MPRPWQLGAIAALVAALAVVAATLAFGDAHPLRAMLGQDPEPPCPEGWFAGPRGTTCQRDDEVCHTFLSGADDRTVSCPVRSPDGRGALKGTLGGSGTARVLVRDAAGKPIYDRTHDFAEGAVALVELRGEPGAWSLATTFRAAGGADIYLWG